MTKQVTEELIHQIAGMLKAAGWHAKADRQWEGLRAVIQHIARELTDEPCEPLPSMPIVCRQCGSTDTMPWPHSSVKSQGASRDASSPCPSVHDHMWAADGHCMRCYAQRTGGVG